MVKSADNNGPAAKPRVLGDEALETAGPYFFIQKKKTHKLTVDSVLLSEFISHIKDDANIIDLGTGSGIIPLLLASWTNSKITGVEIDIELAGLAKRNIENNRLSARTTIINADYRDLSGSFPQGSFDIVVSNPPYIKAGTGRVSPCDVRAAARSEIHGGLSDLLKISAYLLKDDGRAYYVFPVKRLFEMLSEARAAGLKPLRLRFVHTDVKKAAKLFLIELGREGGLIIEEPLFI